MAIINHFIISSTANNFTKRDWGDNYWENSNSARWAFFAIFIVLVIIVILGTIRVNKKRSQHGQQPLYGTRWMTPPSYRQSQNQYDQPDHLRDPDLPSAYVPTYTQHANEFDMGYYDSSGTFHPNPNAKNALQHPPATHQRHGSNSSSSGDNNLNNGSGGATNLPSDLEGQNHSNDDIGDISRPVGPPPTSRRNSISQRRDSNLTTTNNNNNNVQNNEVIGERIIETDTIFTSSSGSGNEDFERPNGPPPSTSTKKVSQVYDFVIEKKK
ncbi:hypothetical protein KGF54_003365 [Candida jiufengensis]|uniref:uncharacterized protein n=1 Tax=Candida jiufengensis TaxID=497108 RepID=UPI0022242F86|nr:uncharacterized protein KGF54_003365 [Candida jiufengensis]KAI5952498.1 hypothetical protein KGF54_003365 [Candida jiufengensis]